HLRRLPVDVTLVDRRNYHLFQPLSYQVATGALSAGEIAYPLRAVFASSPNVAVLLGEGRDFDLDARPPLPAPRAGAARPVARRPRGGGGAAAARRGPAVGGPTAGGPGALAVTPPGPGPAGGGAAAGGAGALAVTPPPPGPAGGGAAAGGTGDLAVTPPPPGP